MTTKLALGVCAAVAASMACLSLIDHFHDMIRLGLIGF